MNHCENHKPKGRLVLHHQWIQTTTCSKENKTNNCQQYLVWRTLKMSRYLSILWSMCFVFISHFVISTLFFFFYACSLIYIPKCFPSSNSPGFLTDIYIIAARTFAEIHYLLYLKLVVHEMFLMSSDSGSYTGLKTKAKQCKSKLYTLLKSARKMSQKKVKSWLKALKGMSRVLWGNHRNDVVVWGTERKKDLIEKWLKVCVKIFIGLYIQMGLYLKSFILIQEEG